MECLKKTEKLRCSGKRGLSCTMRNIEKKEKKKKKKKRKVHQQNVEQTLIHASAKEMM